MCDVESEQEENFLTLSLHSFPCQSDQEQTPSQKAKTLFPSTCQYNNGSNYKRTLKNVHFLQHQLKQEHCLYVREDRKRAQLQAAEQKSMGRGPIQHLVNLYLNSFRIPLYHHLTHSRVF